LEDFLVSSQPWVLAEVVNGEINEEPAALQVHALNSVEGPRKEWLRHFNNFWKKIGSEDFL